MKERKAVYEYIEDHEAEHVARVQEYLRQPSISADGTGMSDCSRLLQEYYRELGCREVAEVDVGGYPFVWAVYSRGAPKTIINYSMYDVQPVEGEVWSSPPFEAHLQKRPPFERVIVARGAHNSKGGYRMWLNALQSIIAVEGKLPVNIYFTAEGEEELGSPHLPAFIDRYLSRLQEADGVLSCIPCQQHDGGIRLTLGVKGIYEFRLECSGERWGKGPEKHDVHSSMKAIADSPVWRLIHALSTLTAPDGNRVLVEGFYDNAASPTSEDLELIRDLSSQFDSSLWQQTHAIRRWADDLSGQELLMRFMFSPTLNIQGIWGGHTGAGSKTVLPHKGVCQIDVRLVPGMTVEEVHEKLRAHLDRHGYGDIAILPLGGYPPARTSLKTKLVQAVVQMYRDHEITPQIWPLSGGSWPMYLYCEKPLRLPYCAGGLGHGGGAHSPDEYLVIEGNGAVAGLVEAEKSYVDILYNFMDA